MNTQLIVEISCTTVGIIIILLLLKIILLKSSLKAVKTSLKDKQEEIRLMSKAFEEKEKESTDFQKDLGSLWGKHLNSQKEIKRLKTQMKKACVCKANGKDLNTAINEMNKHSKK